MSDQVECDTQKRWKDTAILLGAGASHAEGAPLQADLLRDYMQQVRQRHPRGVHPSMDSELVDYFGFIWGIETFGEEGMENAKFPTFEEALGILEIAHARDEFFRGFGGLDQHTTRGQELRGHLVSLLAIVLAERL